jgi:hypothetical protein
MNWGEKGERKGKGRGEEGERASGAMEAWVR